MQLLVKDPEVINREDPHDSQSKFIIPAFDPRVENCSIEEGENVENDWAAAGAVAGVLAIGLAIVVYICSVCQARSFHACMSAVRNYWGRGC